MTTREKLEKCEDKGNCYNGELLLGLGIHGTYWIDYETDKIYEYETDDLDLLSADLTDEQISRIEERDFERP